VPDFSNFLEVQTKTAWGRTLVAFSAFCNLKPASTVLDVGTGPGLLASIFAQNGSRALGVDIDFTLLAARISPNLAQADAFHLPFESATFDLITSVNVLFLLENPIDVLSHWRTFLKPDGQLCLLNPSENLSVATAKTLADQRDLDGTSRQSLLNWASNAESHARWTEAETKFLLAAAGFRLVEACLKVGPGFARLIRASIAT